MKIKRYNANEEKKGRRNMKKVDKKKYLQLFLSTFKLSACTFGGGFVIIPLMRKRFMDELGWIEEQEMLDLTAIASPSSPCSIRRSATTRSSAWP